MAAARPFFAIGVPAVLTQLATPVGNAFVTAEIARFGDDAVAGWAIIGRIMPVAFGVIFALSGAVGPILGQNFGARRYDRLQSTMRDSLTVTIVYVLAVWALLALFAGPIAALFGATGHGPRADHLLLPVRGRQRSCSTARSSCRARPSTISATRPIRRCSTGAARRSASSRSSGSARHYFGAEGVLAGCGLGAVVFGIASMVVCFRTVAGIAQRRTSRRTSRVRRCRRPRNSPFSTGKASTLQ